MKNKVRFEMLSEIESVLIDQLDTDNQDFIKVVNEIIEYVRKKMWNASTN